MNPAGQQDLIVLAADLSMQRAIDEVLKRHQALGTRRIEWKSIQQPNYDTAFLQRAHLTLQAQSRNYQHALAVCDRHGCAKPKLPREELEGIIEANLGQAWDDCAAAVVIDPELEIWFWADSPHVAGVIGWSGGMADLQRWLRTEKYLAEGAAKPANPKAALHHALQLAKKQKSSSLFQSLAAKVSLQSCIDPAFLKLKETLQRWFPASA